MEITVYQADDWGNLLECGDDSRSLLHGSFSIKGPD